MGKKLTKIAASILTVALVSSFVVPTKVSANDTTYKVETIPYYAIEEGVDTVIYIDIVTNPNGGAQLGLLHIDEDNDGMNDHLLVVIDGDYSYAFKDMDKDGELDPYEDWRLSTDDRAADLAAQLAATDEGIKKIAGLMLFSSHQGNSAAGLTTAQKAFLDDSNLRNVLNSAGNDVSDSVGWSNAMQAYVEASNFNIPVNFSSDPRSTAGTGDMYSSAAEYSDISAWPSNLGMAATFSTDHMYNFAKATSAEYRALGITTALGPQIDLATEPRWSRNGGTFGENTVLATDMAQAYADGSQSTYSSTGQDLGWGSDSINVMIKHFPGDGPGEAGRESHMDSGKYAVYPGNNFEEHLKPFTEGGLNLNGLTNQASAIMTSYSIGVAADGSPLGGGDSYVGTAYNEYKMNLLREDLAYDGVVCTDWAVTTAASESARIGTAWGAENLTVVERHYAILELGTDMFGGNNDSAPILEAYDMFVENYGEAYARERFADSARRILKLSFNVGTFENPYLDLDTSESIAGSADKLSDGYNAQLDSIVMLKNKDNTIQAATNNEKEPSEMTVYIPMLYVGGSSAHWDSSLNLEVARSVYGNVITDELQSDGSYTAPDLTGVDKVIIGVTSPYSGGWGAGQIINSDGTKSYYPLSLQYGEYTADGDNVRRNSIAGDILTDGTQENRSYYGESFTVSNTYDLDAILNAVEAVEQSGQDIPIIVYMNASGPAIVAEFEDKVDVIVVGFSVSESAMYEVVNGYHEPNGLLPMQFPANMDTVEANLEDVAGDLVCHKDTEGNTYDVAFGLNWSGIIDDSRVQKYNPNRPDTDKEIINPTPEDPEILDPNPETPDANDNNIDNGESVIQTGDNTNITGYTLVAGLAILVAIIVVRNKRKRA